MSHSPGEIVLGAAVLAIAAGFVFYAGQVTGFGGERDGYPLTASFRSAEGVNVGTDVRLAGVKIGTVTDVDLNPETYRAETTFTLDQGVRVPDDSAAVVASEGLLGGNYVEISPGGSMFYFEPGDEIIDTQGAVSLISLLVRFVSGEAEE
ncbi:outer membrane lipid asymmetry maintenance protein MlaD [Rhodosalinus sp.]|uniref:outer membrane lipid asymmetry maintenance protein MlaD n=1 Tax=Rhodosalinus sp. TaxID=2047741 RepID=UPI003563A007